MAWRRPSDKPLSEPMMVSLLTHICLTRLQWVKASATEWLSIEAYVDVYLDTELYEEAALSVIKACVTEWLDFEASAAAMIDI